MQEMVPESKRAQNKTVFSTHTLTVGSSADCDICIFDPTINAKHLSISYLGKGNYQVNCLSPDIGTFFAGKKITDQVVRVSDVIQIGHRPVEVRWLSGFFNKSMSTDGTGQAKTMAVTSNTLIVGREEPSDIVINQPIISRSHVEIRIVGDDFSVRDVGSSNGTFVNDIKIGDDWMICTPNDSLRLGTYHVPKHMLYEWVDRLSAASGFVTRTLSEDFSFPTEGVVTLGRNPASTIIIEDPTVSWDHAKIEITKDRIQVVDLGSSNGVFVDDQRVTQSIITKSSALRIGAVRINLQDPSVMSGDIPRGEIRLDALDLARILPNGLRILDEVKLSIYPGEMVALMGPSGAGKTTLLETLTGQKLATQGMVLLNGKELQSHWEEFKHHIGYVPQEDVMHRDMTVYEVIYHTAKLRLPSDFPEAAIIETVDRTITRMGLAHIRDSIIGGEDVRGISGGQRKRVNIALEMLTEPTLLFLDEPTSGLDSSSTLEVLEILRSLADNGKTIIMTIHQPRLEVIQLLNNMILLAKGGKLAYYGPADASQYFTRMTGWPKPPEMNPADFVMDLLESVAIKKTADEWKELYRKSTLHSKYVEMRLGKTDTMSSLTKPQLPSAWKQTKNLFHRYAKRKVRDRSSLIIQLLQAPVIAGILAVLFINESNNLVNMNISPKLESIPVLINALQLQNGIHPTLFLVCAAAFWFGCSNVARELVSDMPVFLRERRTGLRVSSYLAAIFVYQALLSSVQTLVMTILIWTCLGMSSSLFLGWGILWMTALVGIGLGLMVSAISRTEVMAISLVPLLLFPQLLLGGFIKLYGKLEATGWQMYVSDLMPIRWSFEALMIAEYDAMILENKHLRTMETIIGFPNFGIPVTLGILLGFYLVFWICTSVLLARKKAN